MKNKNIILIIFLILAVAVGGGLFKKSLPKSEVVDSQQDIYYCPMHTNYTSPKPGVCPICFMDLVLKEKDSGAGTSSSKVKGYATVYMDPKKQQSINLQVSRVVETSLVKIVHATGVVVHDLVLYNARLEYISAWREFRLIRARKIIKEEFRDVQSRFLKAEYELLHMGLTQKEIEELRQINFSAVSDRDERNFSWNSPQILQPLTTSKDIQSLYDQNSSWIYAEVFEGDIPYVNIGQRAEVEIPSHRKILEGVVRGISSEVEPDTRTVRVRIQLLEHENDLKANMYVKVKLPLKLAEGLVIPREAVMMTGERTIVFVQTATGHFEPCEVVVGQQADGMVEILSGLKKGDLVASGANFLLDSESRLKASLESVVPESSSSDQKPTSTVGGHSHGS